MRDLYQKINVLPGRKLYVPTVRGAHSALRRGPDGQLQGVFFARAQDAQDYSERLTLRYRRLKAAEAQLRWEAHQAQLAAEAAARELLATVPDAPAAVAALNAPPPEAVGLPA